MKVRRADEFRVYRADETKTAFLLFLLFFFRSRRKSKVERIATGQVSGFTERISQRSAAVSADDETKRNFFFFRRSRRQTKRERTGNKSTTAHKHTCRKRHCTHTQRGRTTLLTREKKRDRRERCRRYSGKITRRRNERGLSRRGADPGGAGTRFCQDTAGLRTRLKSRTIATHRATNDET